MARPKKAPARKEGLVYLRDAASLLPELTPQEQAALDTSLLPWAGHYRLDRLNWNSVEDFRRRMERRGVSYRELTSCQIPLLCRIVTEAGLPRPLLPAYPPGPFLLRDMAEPWRRKISKEVKPFTLNRYEKLLEQNLIPLFGDLDLALLDRQHLEPLQAKTEAEAGASVFSQLSTILYAILDFAVERELPSPSSSAPFSFAQAAEQWLSEVSESCTWETVQAYQKALEKSILPELGDTPLYLVGKTTLTQYYKSLLERDTAPTILFRIRSILKGIFQWGLEQKWIPQIPQLPFKETDMAVHFHHPDRDKLENALRRDPELPAALIIRLAWNAGLTASEIQTLRWTQVDLGEKVLHMPSRTIPVPIPYELLALLLEARQAHPKAQMVILTVRDARPIASRQHISVIARQYLDKHGLFSVRLIDLRHSYIVGLLDSGHPADKVAAFAGYKHSDDLLLLYRQRS